MQSITLLEIINDERVSASHAFIHDIPVHVINAPDADMVTTTGATNEPLDAGRDEHPPAPDASVALLVARPANKRCSQRGANDVHPEENDVAAHHASHSHFTSRIVHDPREVLVFSFKLDFREPVVEERRDRHPVFMTRIT
jgi:hypothetical protein